MARLAGSVEITEGGVTSGADPVVKLQDMFAPIALPAKSFTRVVTVALYTLLASRSESGLKLAITPAYVTVPGTDVVPCIKPMDDALMVDASIPSLKVIASVLVNCIPMALFA